MNKEYLTSEYISKLLDRKKNTKEEETYVIRVLSTYLTREREKQLNRKN